MNERDRGSKGINFITRQFGIFGRNAVGYSNPEAYVEIAKALHREILAEDIANKFDSLIPRDIYGPHPRILELAAGPGIISQALLNKGFHVTITDKIGRASCRERVKSWLGKGWL